MSDVESRIANSQLLTGIFGTWPSFHDAEVVRLCLDRDGAAGALLEADIHLFEMTSEVTPDGFYRHRHDTMATLRFAGVDELSVVGFNHQNVLSELSLAENPSHTGWEVSFDASFGVAIQFSCESISVLAAAAFPGAA